MHLTGNALHTRKGWAVASVFRTVRNKIAMTLSGSITGGGNSLSVSSVLPRIQHNRTQYKEALKTLAAFGGVLALMVAMMHPALATDLLSSQDSSVTATFGHGSSIEKYFYYGEIFIAVFTYIKSRSPLSFVGLAVMILFTRIGFQIAAGG
ncbi:type IV conjugative transfer system pilin TraA [Mangrovibacter phragmitis]|uniref:type IV conjugative transfer system pilin TraA n=1 Tax=Mangrovibacter phragmitis TaxID=1691903 RepID=UPI00336A99D6